MTASVVQSQPIALAWSGSLGADATVGNTLLYFIFGYEASSPSSSAPLYDGGAVTGASQLWEVSQTGEGADSMYSSCWMLPNIQSAGKSVSVTVDGCSAPSDYALVVVEVAGLGSSPALDSTPVTQAAASGDPDIGPTAAASSAALLVIAACAVYGSFPGDGPATGWVNVSGGSLNGITSYQDATEGDAYTWSYTGNGNPFSGGIAVIKSASAPPSPSGTGLLMAAGLV